MSGGELWRKGVGDAVDGLDATAGRVTLAWPHCRYGDSLYVLDAGTGEEQDERDFRGHVVRGPYKPVVDVLTYQRMVRGPRRRGGGPLRRVRTLVRIPESMESLAADHQ